MLDAVWNIDFGSPAAVVFCPRPPNEKPEFPPDPNRLPLLLPDVFVVPNRELEEPPDEAGWPKLNGPDIWRV